MELRIGNEAILAYRRLSYRPWYAIAEFIDNSTDTYFRKENRERLDKVFEEQGEQLTVEVTYDRDAGLLRIEDNSIGMSASELNDAMVIGQPPSETSGRSEFGMGMKTAAIWFADQIEIRTKKLGEEEEIRIILDVQEFVKGNSELPTFTTKKPKNQHYTVIDLTGLQRKLGPASLQKAKEFLASIYRMDLRNKHLKLVVNGAEVDPPISKNDDAFLTRQDGSPFLVDITSENLQINNRQVKGWIGVLKPGFTGRSHAGFALVRHNRTLRGWLDAWKPEEIFGEARNDTINQRLAGELFLDSFKATHTKDAIDFENDDEELLGEALRDIANKYDLIRAAKKKTRGDDPDAGIEQAEAQARFQAQVASAKFQDTVRILDVPRPEIAKVATEVLIDATANSEPQLALEIGGNRKAFLYEIRLSPNDPYFEYEVQSNADLKVVINLSHPALDLLTSAESRLAHYHHVMLDALAEWTCAQQQEPLDPSSIRLMKDRLFRAISEVDSDL